MPNFTASAMLGIAALTPTYGGFGAGDFREHPPLIPTFSPKGRRGERKTPPEGGV